MRLGKFKVTFVHDRKTGTSCILKDPKTSRVEKIGNAYLAEGDTFNKKIGRKIALKRALENVDRLDRHEVWFDFLRKVKI